MLLLLIPAERNSDLCLWVREAREKQTPGWTLRCLHGLPLASWPLACLCLSPCPEQPCELVHLSTISATDSGRERRDRSKASLGCFILFFLLWFHGWLQCPLVSMNLSCTGCPLGTIQSLAPKSSFITVASSYYRWSALCHIGSLFWPEIVSTSLGTQDCTTALCTQTRFTV